MKSSLSCQTLARLELERNIDLMKFFHSMWMQEIFLCVVSKLIHPNILIKFLQSDFTDINGYCWITQHKTSLQSCFSNLIKKPIFDLALSGIWHNKHCFQPGLKNDFRRSRISENFWTFLSCCLNVLKSKELELNQHCELPLHHSWLKSIMLKYLFVIDG